MSTIETDASCSQAAEALREAFSRNASPIRVLVNLFCGYLSTASGMLTGLVVTPVLVRCLGAEQFGLWVALGSLAGYAGLLELGLTAAVTKRVAASGGAGDLRQLQRVVSTAVLLYWAVAIMQLGAVAALVSLLPHIYHIPAASLGRSRACLGLLGLGAAVSYAGAVYSIAVVGSGRAHLSSFITGLQFIAVGALNCLAVALGHGVVWLGAIALGAALTNTASCVWVARRILPSVRIAVRDASLRLAGEMVRYGARNASISVCGTIAYGADALVIGILLPISNVANYAIAARLVQAVRSVADKPLTVLMPSYSHLDALGERTRQFRAFVESTKWSIILALPPAIALCAIGDRIIQAWVGDGHHASHAIAAVLSIVMLTEIPGVASYAILTATERSRPLFWTMLIVAPVNLILSVLLTRVYGPIGTALGSLVTSVGSNLLVFPAFACREMSFQLSEYVRGVLRPLPLPSAVMVAVAFLMRQLSPAGTLLTVLEFTTIAVAGWGCFAAFGGVNVERLRQMCRPRTDGHRGAVGAKFGSGEEFDDRS